MVAAAVQAKYNEQRTPENYCALSAIRMQLWDQACGEAPCDARLDGPSVSTRAEPSADGCGIAEPRCRSQPRAYAVRTGALVEIPAASVAIDDAHESPSDRRHEEEGRPATK